jgi:hypothetical protein
MQATQRAAGAANVAWSARVQMRSGTSQQFRTAALAGMRWALASVSIQTRSMSF